MSGLVRYVAIRLSSLVAALLIVAAVAFALIRLMPGDPATAMLPMDAQLWEVQAMRERLGLDAPLPVQFGEFITRATLLDFGDSLFFRQPIKTIIGRKMEATFLLAVCSIALAVVVGIPVGVAAAANRGRWLDQSLMASALLTLSLPNFWLGLMLILAFAVQRPWFPVTGWVSLSEAPGDTIRFLVLPSITLGLGLAASIARMTRSSVLEVLAADFVRTARAKGLPNGTVLYKHALRSAVIPVLATIGLSFSSLLGGAAVTETVFTIPGLGAWMVDSVARRDYAVLQALLVLFALINLAVHLIIDLSYALIDPRIQYR